MRHIFLQPFLSILFLIFLHTNSIAQCINVDSVNPYLQNFEASNGNWTSGGTLDDWEWGHPAKAIITGAASGQNCWITGTLTGGDYNSNERSYLVSPCFNFTNLPYPYIEFKVFWELEYKYDGACFQYSIDNGASWLNVGAVNEAANCLNANWFNYPNISNMTGLGPNKQGWSGTIKPSNGPCSGGNGSGAWLTASHTLNNLAGKSNVIFRFTFGAGTTCNSYDGFAFDDIKISNAPPGKVDFKYNCITNATVDFSNLSSPCLTSFDWNFGDPASGNTNMANGVNATHTFSAPGMYTVTLTGSGGGGPPVTITRHIHIINVSAAITKVIVCHNDNNGQATATVSADPGVNNILYTWNTTPVAITPVITGIGPGTYIINVSADSTCTAKDTVTFINPQPLSHSVIKTDAACGNANGSITLMENGGFLPYSYTWSPNVSAGSFAGNLPSGNYVISVKDNAGCIDTVHVQVAGSQPLHHSVVISNISCTNTSGAATITETGGTLPYTYSWSPAGGNMAASANLSAGNYLVTVTDSNNCVDTVHIQIVNTSTLNVSAINIVNVSCYGGSNGSATISAIGTAPYTYSWSPVGGTGMSANNLTAGNYSILVKDNSGCSAIASVIINQPNRIVSVIAPLHTSCGLNNGSVTASATGGTPFYTYTWMPGNIISATITNLAPGTYTVIITDAKGCNDNSQVIINPSAPLKVNINSANTTCNTNNGSASVTPVNGTPPYTYLWSPGNYTVSSINNLSPRQYTVLVKDMIGCSQTATAIIGASTAPVINSIIPADALCSGQASGSAVANVSGGLTPYTFAWSNGIQTYSNTSLANVPAGIYQLTVSDMAGCSNNKTTTIGEPQPMQLSMSAVKTTCGFNNGIAEVNVIGGLSPYQYLWSSGAVDDTAKNLAAGFASVAVTDDNGCSQSGTIYISPSVPLYISLGNDTTICPGNNLLLYPGKFNSYRWQDNSTDSTFLAMISGTYSVAVIDTFGCSATANINIIASCRDIVFPEAFSPNGDKKNDFFGPLGTLSAVSQYTFTVFNRWGQVVFTTKNPENKWNGKIDGNVTGSGVYVWIAEYSFDHRPKKVVKGTVVLIK